MMPPLVATTHAPIKNASRQLTPLALADVLRSIAFAPFGYLSILPRIFERHRFEHKREHCIGVIDVLRTDVALIASELPARLEKISRTIRVMQQFPQRQPNAHLAIS